MLTVTVPAVDRNLLSVAELRAAVGVTDASKDAELLSMGRDVSAAITRACQVAGDGRNPPTLLAETLEETFIDYRQSGVKVFLSRTPIQSVTSIVEAGTTLEVTDYQIDHGAGIINRLLVGTSYRTWAWGNLVFTYVAGYPVAPDDLKFAAKRYVQSLWSERGRDRTLKHREIPGVSTKEWWVEPASDKIVPPEILDLLESGGYVQNWMGAA